MKICVFIGDMYRDFALSIIRNIDICARERGHRVDVFGMCSVPTNNPLHVEGFKSILYLPDVAEYDGVILCYDTLIHENIGQELAEDLMANNDAPPVVTIRTAVSGFYSIIPDNRALMYEIASYVISKCEKGDIGFVTGMEELEDSYERLEGFEDAMRDAGLEISEDMIFHGNYWITQGPEMADHFIREDGSLPEAVICSNDYEAIALCNELIQRGYSIPGDMLVSGIDNTTEGRDHVPSITTIEISKKLFAETAVNVLEDAAAGKRQDLNIYVPGELIRRESTGDQSEQRDVYQSLRLQNIASSVSMDESREFVIINTLFEGALNRESSLQVTLDQFKSVESVRSCYLIRYRENDRELAGYFTDKGDNQYCDGITFAGDTLLPEGLENESSGMRIHLALTYRNEVYGYVILVVDTAVRNFINFKIEYLLSQVGQTANKLELYGKLFGIADVMSLYIRDPLTETLNRRGFEKKISELFDKDGNMLKKLSAVSIDMDGLKYINDTFGHNVGDDAIREMAKCIDSSLEEDEFVARMGGDEFSAILILSDTGRSGKFIRNVRKNIREVNLKGTYPFELSASIGTCDLTDWHSLTDCMKKADKAMYLEKKAKKKNREQ